MKIFAAVLDWAEWEDMVLFTSLEIVQQYIVKQIRAHMEQVQTGNVKDYIYYDIGVFSGNENGALKPQTSYIMRTDIPAEQWFDIIKNDNADFSQLFEEEII